jgi:hypothetical protein
MKRYIALYEDDNQTKQDSGDFPSCDVAYKHFKEKYGAALVEVCDEGFPQSLREMA